MFHSENAVILEVFKTVFVKVFPSNNLLRSQSDHSIFEMIIVNVGDSDNQKWYHWSYGNVSKQSFFKVNTLTTTVLKTLSQITAAFLLSLRTLEQ